MLTAFPLVASQFAGRTSVKPSPLVLTLLDEAYEKRTWHGPNLKQAIRGVTAKQADMVESKIERLTCVPSSKLERKRWRAV